MPTPSKTPWFEERNWAHLRDSEFLRRAEPLLEEMMRTRTSGEGPITIASYQAGMVPYYLFTRYPGKFRFYDMLSLTTSDFGECKGLRRSHYGMAIGYSQWIEWEGKCTPPIPDLIFGRKLFPTALAPRYSPVFNMDMRAERSNGRVEANVQMFLAQRTDG